MYLGQDKATVPEIATISSFNAGGLLAASDPGQKKPATCIVVAGITNGSYVRIDPATTGFECKDAGYYHLK